MNAPINIDTAVKIDRYAPVPWITLSACAAVFADWLSLFERVAGKGACLRRGYAVRLIFSQNRPFSRLQAITELVHIETSSPGLGEDTVRTPFLLVNVVLYLFGQHLDFGVVEFLIWCAGEELGYKHLAAIVLDIPLIQQPSSTCPRQAG